MSVMANNANHGQKAQSPVGRRSAQEPPNLTASLDSSSLHGTERAAKEETEPAHFTLSEDTELSIVGIAKTGSRHSRPDYSCLLGNSGGDGRVLRFLDLWICSCHRFSGDLLPQAARYPSP